MLILLFFVFLLQFFTHWLFFPFTTFLSNLLKVKFLPFISLFLLFFFFTVNTERNFSE